MSGTGTLCDVTKGRASIATGLGDIEWDLGVFTLTQIFLKPHILGKSVLKIGFGKESELNQIHSLNAATPLAGRLFVIQYFN